MKKFNWLDWVLVAAVALAIAGGAYYLLKPKVVKTMKSETVSVAIVAELKEIEFEEQRDFFAKYSGDVTIGDAKVAKAKITSASVRQFEDSLQNLTTGEQKVGEVPHNWIASFKISATATKTDKGYAIDGESVVAGEEYLVTGKGLQMKAKIVSIKEEK